MGDVVKVTSSVNGIFQQLITNPIVIGGASVALLGASYYVWDFCKNLVYQHYIQTLVIEGENVVFQWVIDHINKNSSRETKNLQVDSKLKYDDHGKGYLKNKFRLGYGTHYFYYKDQWIQVTRQKTREDGASALINKWYGNGSKSNESIQLTTVGGTPEFWETFLMDASRKGIKDKNKGVSIERYSDRYGWDTFGKSRRKRPIESVILAESLSTNIQNDLTNFLESSDWYIQSGVPYRRGYLFYGPPGTGKSSFIMALASHFGYGIGILSLNAIENDSELDKAINNPSDRHFILLEDIDAAFKPRDEPDEQKTSKESVKNNENEIPKCRISLSGLLNALDGVASSEGRIIFMTTNHREKLDSALIRPGRIDIEAYFENCTKEMLEQLFKRFFMNASIDECTKFSETIIGFEKPVSPAQVQRFLTRHKKSINDALENLDKFFD